MGSHFDKGLVMLPRDGVVWAYRLMLGREPESEAAIDAACQLPDIEALRQAFLHSEEFAVVNKVTWLLGYWVAAPVLGGKYLMWIDLGDRYMSFGCLLDNYEPVETEFLRTVVKPGDVVVDAGANLGWFTLVASDAIGNAGRVHAFEPRSETADYLEKTVALNGLGDRAVVHRCALSAAAGQGVLAWSRATDNPGGSFLATGEPGDGMEHQPITLRRLDDLALPRLDFLKADVEGAELQLFRGAQQTLTRCRPVILAELNPEMLARVSGVPPESFFAFFDTFGYRCYIIDQERCGEEVSAFPDGWHKPLVNLGLLPDNRKLDDLAVALPGLAQACAARFRAANATPPADSIVYRLTRFRQRAHDARRGSPRGGSD